MFRAIAHTQWKSSRGFVLLATVATFAIPLLSLRSAIEAGGGGGAFLSSMLPWSLAYSIAAAGVGLVLAILAWSPDHRGRHVYALTLPVERWRYVLLRLGAGALFIVPPVVALFVSAELVARSGSIPIGLRAYPVALVVRFALAAAVAYAIFFAITSATARTAGIILGVIAGLIAAQYLMNAAHLHAAVSLGYVWDILFAGPGLLAVFTGRWMLIDA